LELKRDHPAGVIPDGKAGKYEVPKSAPTVGAIHVESS
jgi:hypothetical protein